MACLEGGKIFRCIEGGTYYSPRGVSVAPGRGAWHRGRGVAVTIILIVTLRAGSVTAPLAHVIRAESRRRRRRISPNRTRTSFSNNVLLSASRCLGPACYRLLMADGLQA